ncbi:hypothetical protein [Serratia marcescens]|uniref:MrpH family fimbial adhesin n=1 Tax=Serratia marcescens TaxID=615 RepID=UPI003BAE76DA
MRCNISLQDIDFGLLSISDVNGATKNEMGQLTCNAYARVKLSLGAGDLIHLYSNGMNVINSDVYVNGVRLNREGLYLNAIDGAQGGNVTSVLHGLPSLTSGEFSGSDYIIMSIE